MRDNPTRRDIWDAVDAQGRQDMSETIETPFGEDLIERKGQFDYVGHEHYIARLNLATGNQWDFEILDRWIQSGLMSNRDGSAVDVQVIHGRLTIPGMGSREDWGIQEIQGGGADSIKGAVSDCIKRCAKSFGLGLGLYMKTAPTSVRPMTSAPTQQPRVTHPSAEASAQQINGICVMLKKQFGWTQAQVDVVEQTMFRNEDGSIRLGRGIASAYIEALNKGELPPDLQDIKAEDGTITVRGGGTGVAEGPYPVPVVHLEDPLPKQKADWKATLEKIAPDQHVAWSALLVQTEAAVKENPGKQVWRMTAMAQFAPDLKVLGALDEMSDRLNCATGGLMEAIAKRHDALQVVAEVKAAEDAQRRETDTAGLGRAEAAGDAS